ncbi:MAG: hypothetical protein OEL75_00145, partial [Kiritimatiellaceae bacterium]|nr:hypothetical protein [Kiritimatiellaceae bacterium]
MSKNKSFNRARNVIGALDREMSCMRLSVFFLLVAGSVVGADLSVLHTCQSPTRLARGPEGKVYVTDHQVGSVFIYDSSLSVIGELKYQNNPLGIAVGVDGTMYVGNRGAKAIQAYDSNGDFIRNVGEGMLHMPSDIALDLYGNLYVADSPAHCIRIFNMDGGHLGDIGSVGTSDGEFKFPVSVDVAYRTNETGQVEGELFVADQGNFRIQVFNLSGNLLRVLNLPRIEEKTFGGDPEGHLGRLQSIAIDNQYQIHAADTVSSMIQVWDADTGAYKGWNYGSFGTNPGQLNLPLDILITDPVDGTNQVIVANNANERVEVIQN